MLMTPDALNYHHLLYFWAVAKEGSLRRASELLHVSQPSISSQLKQLEESLGPPLFTRTTRRLILTDTGQKVLEYAENNRTPAPFPGLRTWSLGTRDLPRRFSGRTHNPASRTQTGCGPGGRT